MTWTKEDQKKFHKQWNKETPHLARARNYRHKYGITVAEYDSLFAAQGGVCAICGKSCAQYKRLSVDHNHVTKKIRGLLCSRCNTGLGKFNDTPDLLIRAAKYLRNNDD